MCLAWDRTSAGTWALGAAPCPSLLAPFSASEPCGAHMLESRLQAHSAHAGTPFCVLSMTGVYHVLRLNHLAIGFLRGGKDWVPCVVYGTK